MKTTRVFAGLGAGIALGLAAAVLPVEPKAVDRRMAVTFDDLPGPAAGLVSNAVPDLRENTRKLLAHFREHDVPVVGFVNEGKLFQPGESEKDAAARTAVLDMWLEAGFDLGNHTYSHHNLNRTPLEEFEADVVKGEAVTTRLLAARQRKLRYFRHPFLHVGLDLEKRRAFEAFLAGRGYTIAPVTIDDDDYVLAAVYADALRRGDRDTGDGVAAAYVPYMEEVVAFVEDVAERLLGRPIPHVLLLHANTLNTDRFGALATSFRKRGYRFVTLEEALRDEAYARPDTYVGNWGISWLHHWELTEGRKRSPSPDPPDWIQKAYAALSR
jgi:peptidoglycan/xylan/chitin deacetylase (PgdA/CDA1 family)